MERFKEAAKFTLATLFFLACAVGIGWLEGPGIWRDLGVRSAGGGAPISISFNVSTPDAESFRRAESQLTAMLARAVAQGQRNL